MKLLLVLFVVLLSVVQAKENDLYFQAGLIGMNMDYREYDDNSQILDSEKSDISQMMGIELGVSYVLNAADDDFSEFDALFERIVGESDYVGAYIGSGLGYGSLHGTTENTIVNLDATYLYGLRIMQNMHLLTGAAFGYRSWERSLSADQVETYTWGYITPKVGVQYAKESVKITFVLGYKYGISPQMSATGIADTFELGSANTLDSTFKLNYKLTSKSAVYATYVYENQVIEKSNIVYDSNGNGYLEPDSTANNQYIKFGFAFKY